MSRKQERFVWTDCTVGTLYWERIGGHTLSSLGGMSVVGRWVGAGKQAKNLQFTFFKV